jgi:predicted nucleic acid-binding Zn ribbon protein
MLKFNPRFIPARGAPKLKARERALAEWRGVNLTAQERAQRNTGKALAEIMPKVLTGLRMDCRQAEAEIVRVWNHLIDPKIIAHAQPTGINKGTLFVRVDSDVWRDEIVRYRRREILERLQHSFGREMIARISFRVG